jgi:hypothetical protein
MTLGIDENRLLYTLGQECIRLPGSLTTETGGILVETCWLLMVDNTYEGVDLHLEHQRFERPFVSDGVDSRE